MEKIASNIFSKRALTESEKHFIKGGEGSYTTTYNTASTESTWLFWSDTVYNSDSKADYSGSGSGGGAGK